VIPTNEQETIALFAQLAEEMGYHFKKMGTRCPDAILVKDGKTIRVEFEYTSMNFKRHKHNPEDVDLVICWIDDWLECPLPVLSLEVYVTLSRPMPKWKRFLLWWKEFRIERIKHRADIEQEKADKRDKAYCKMCGTQMTVKCALSDNLQYGLFDRVFYTNYIVKYCPHCGYESTKFVTEPAGYKA